MVQIICTINEQIKKCTDNEHYPALSRYESALPSGKDESQISAFSIFRLFIITIVTQKNTIP